MGEHRPTSQMKARLPLYIAREFNVIVVSGVIVVGGVIVDHFWSSKSSSVSSALTTHLWSKCRCTHADYTPTLCHEDILL